MNFGEVKPYPQERHAVPPPPSGVTDTVKNVPDLSDVPLITAAPNPEEAVRTLREAEPSHLFRVIPSWMRKGDVQD